MGALLLVVPLMALVPGPAVTQGAQGGMDAGEMFRTIASLDRALFEASYDCDLVTLRTFFVEDLEFYHDRTGLSVGLDGFIEATRKNVCGKMRRELVPSTMEVHPIAGYGALQIGVHRFHHPGREDTEPVGQGKFIHVWKQEGPDWRITRVISYDHRLAPGQ